MTKACRFAAALALFAALAATFAACRPAVSAGTKPSADPSVSSKATVQSNSCTTAASVASSSSPAMDFLPGDKPYLDLDVKNISRIRMIVYRDSQAPEFPDPFKDATSPKDLQALVSILSIIEIKAKTDESHMPVGATGYSFFVTMKDGNVTQIYLYGDQNLSEPDRNIYAIQTVPDMEAAFSALSGRERLLPNTSDTPELQNSSLFELNGWNYYLEPIEKGSSMPASLVREDGNGNIETVDKLVDAIHPAIFHGQNRIVCLEYTAEEEYQISSIKPDGSDRKAYKASFEMVGTFVWDDGYLYYMGQTKGINYPSPLYRIDENLTKEEKVMTLPGALLTVKDGNAYCLSSDHKSLLKLPSGEAVATFNNRIENTEYSAGKWILYEKGGNIYFWTAEGGAVKTDHN